MTGQDVEHQRDMSSPSGGESSTEEMKVSPIHKRFLETISRGTHSGAKVSIPSLLNECIAECIGTMMIVIFGVGAVCSAVMLKENADLFQVTIVFAFGIALAIISTASVSQAHLNPAVSFAVSIFQPESFSFKKLLAYWLAQYIGGFLGGAFNLMIFAPVYKYFESTNNINRGSPSSLVTASTFGEYFPLPGGLLPDSVINTGFAFLVEAWGTGLLIFVIFSLTEQRQKLIKNREMIPFYIGFTIAILQTLYIPMTQGGFNPARDLGPRIIAAMAGWGKIAIPGPRNGFWIYVIAPKVGAFFGGMVYNVLIRPGIPK